MYRIGLFSQMSKTTVKTLRYYDEMGILHPAHIDEKTGYRYYTSDQLGSIHEIIALRQIGFSIEEISRLMKGEQVMGVLEKRRAEIETEFHEAADKLSRIKHYIDEQKGSISMNYQAVIKELAECTVYYKKMVVPDYDAYFEMIPAIGEEVMAANPTLKLTEPAYSFIVYLDGEFKEKNFKVEFCEAVDRAGNETEAIKFKKIAPTTAVSVLHRGSYDKLGEAYAYAVKWIENNGYSVTDHPRESYIDGIWNKENEEEWLTELQIPVAKK